MNLERRIKKRELKIEQFKRMIFHNFQKRGKYCDVALLSLDGRMRYFVNLDAHTHAPIANKLIFPQYKGSSFHFGG